MRSANKAITVALMENHSMVCLDLEDSVVILEQYGSSHKDHVT
jgi:hypothetical protein